MKQAILIASYSYSGQVHQAAKILQQICGGTLCDLFPRQPYPVGDPKALLRQVRRENKTNQFPKLLPLSCNPSQYSVFFIGSPKWEGKLAPPVVSFLKEYAFCGKILIPFSAGEKNINAFEQQILQLCPKSTVWKGVIVPTLPELVK